MKARHLPLFLTLLLASGCSTVTQTASPDANRSVASGQNTILLLSDIHFNPFADKSLVEKLEVANESDWESIFETNSTGNFAQTGSDTNYPLLKEVLKKTKATAPSAGLVIIPGDFLAHKFQKLYNKASAHPTKKGYRAFVSKTIQFIAHELIKTFPGVQIAPVLGNNDSFEGDYQGHFHDAFYHTFGSSFHMEMSELGYYSVPVSFNPKIRLIGLNTVLFSNKYHDNFGLPNRSNGKIELAWLKHEMKEAKEAGQTAWIVGHIPAGVDPYNTLSALDPIHSKRNPVLFYSEYFNEQYINLIQEHLNDISWMISGHTHENEFRIYGNKKSWKVDRFVPSISPINGNNPSFEVAKLKSGDETPSSIQAEILKQNGWETEPLPSLFERASSLSAIQATFATNTPDRTLFQNAFLSGASTQDIVFSDWKLYSCSLFHLTKDAFLKCYRDRE